jgi:hypothetical protein
MAEDRGGSITVDDAVLDWPSPIVWTSHNERVAASVSLDGSGE